MSRGPAASLPEPRPDVLPPQAVCLSPLERTSADARLLANPFVVPILNRLLGESFCCRYVSSDTCLEGAILQSPHSDIDGDEVFVGGVWKPRGYIVNVPVMECGLHNGPLEVWPGGSHYFNPLARLRRRMGGFKRKLSGLLRRQR
jgi:hypothetical protein